MPCVQVGGGDGLLVDEVHQRACGELRVRGQALAEPQGCSVGLIGGDGPATLLESISCVYHVLEEIKSWGPVRKYKGCSVSLVGLTVYVSRSTTSNRFRTSRESLTKDLGPRRAISKN